jgi:hypothetical protein
MRLYLVPNGEWAGTQADAKVIAKRVGQPFKEVDVPTDKPNLLEFLNLHHVGAPAPEPVEAPPPFVAPPKPTFNTGQPAPGRPGGPRLFSAGPDNDLICEAIEESDGNALARFAEAVACRFASLAKREKAHG